MSDDDTKLKVLGLIQADSSPGHLREIGTEYDIPYSRLIKWRKELEESIENGDIGSLVNADQLMLHRVAAETKKDLEALSPEDEVTKEIDGVVEAIDGLNVLSGRMQATALKLANKIDAMADVVVDAKELNSLVMSLSALQMAFFNKQQTQVNVQNNTYTSNEVSKFKGLKKS